MGALAQIIAEASLPEATATVCTAGSLNAEAEDLDRRYRDASRDGTGTLAGETAEALDLARQLRDVRDRMRAHEHAFRFRALPRTEWNTFIAAHPPRKGHLEQANIRTVVPALLARGCVAVDDKPVDGLDLAEVEALCEVLNQGQIDDLFRTAWAVNTEGVSVPFSPSDFETTEVSATR